LSRLAVALAALHGYSWERLVVWASAWPCHGGTKRKDSRRKAPDYLTSMPMERAVPAMIFSAASRLVVFRSGSLVCAISRTWSRVIEPATLRLGVLAPFSSPAALRISAGAGGVLVTKLKERSS